MPRHIKTAALAGQQEEADAKTRAAVEAIIADVKARGDAAVRDLSERFDKWSPPSFRLSDDEIRALREEAYAVDAAEEKLDTEVRPGDWFFRTPGDNRCSPFRMAQNTGRAGGDFTRRNKKSAIFYSQSLTKKVRNRAK